MRNVLKSVLGALGGVILALLAVRSLSADAQSHGLIEQVMGGMIGGGVLGTLLGLLFWALAVVLVAGMVVWLVTQTRIR